MRTESRVEEVVPKERISSSEVGVGVQDKKLLLKARDVCGTGGRLAGCRSRSISGDSFAGDGRTLRTGSRPVAQT